MRMPGWIARIDRDSVSLDGFVRLADGREVAVRLTDISREGCRAESGEVLTIGETVSVHVPPLDGVMAMVRWALEGSAGLRFEEQLS